MAPEEHPEHEEHAHDHPPEEGRSWVGYAVIKYAFILVITIVILYFIAVYILPLIGGGANG